MLYSENAQKANAVMLIFHLLFAVGSRIFLSVFFFMCQCLIVAPFFMHKAVIVDDQISHGYCDDAIFLLPIDITEILGPCDSTDGKNNVFCPNYQWRLRPTFYDERHHLPLLFLSDFMISAIAADSYTSSVGDIVSRYQSVDVQKWAHPTILISRRHLSTCFWHQLIYDGWNSHHEWGGEWMCWLHVYKEIKMCIFSTRSLLYCHGWQKTSHTSDPHGFIWHTPRVHLPNAPDCDEVESFVVRSREVLLGSSQLRYSDILQEFICCVARAEREKKNDAVAGSIA